MALQGLASFPGITEIIGAQFTFSRGITPSVAVLRVVPQKGFLAEVGTFRLDFGGVHLEFKDCALDLASLRKDQAGLIWTIRLEDRRWRWRNEGGGHYISGHYNKRKPDGEIDTDTEKKPQDLAKLLLKQMGESGYDVSELPNDPRPEVHWDYANPAQQLAQLCEDLACHVVLQLNNKVKLCANGKGKNLPADGTVTEGGYGFDSQGRPDSLLVVGGPLRFEDKFLLEPVGEEIDGKIVPIDDLTYKPLDGWHSITPGDYWDDNVPNTYRKDGKVLYAYELARRSVWKWFRIKNMAGGGFKPEKGLDDKVKVEKLEQLLPLGDGLLETITDDDGRKIPKPYELTGEICRLNDDEKNSDSGELYAGRFDVDRQLGIVRSSEPLVKYNATAITLIWTDPNLYLRTSYSVKDSETRMPIRFTRERKLKGKKHNTGSRVISRPEIDRTLRSEYAEQSELGEEPTKVAKTHDNKADVDKQADHYLDVVTKEYEVDPSEEYGYAGLVKIDPDGAISQVSWKVGDKAAATTRASRGVEGDIYTPDFKARRKDEKAKDADEKSRMTDVDMRRVTAAGRIA